MNLPNRDTFLQIKDQQTHDCWLLFPHESRGKYTLLYDDAWEVLAIHPVLQRGAKFEAGERLVLTKQIILNGIESMPANNFALVGYNNKEAQWRVYKLWFHFLGASKTKLLSLPPRSVSVGDWVEFDLGNGDAPGVGVVVQVNFETLLVQSIEDEKRVYEMVRTTRILQTLDTNTVVEKLKHHATLSTDAVLLSEVELSDLQRIVNPKCVDIIIKSDAIGVQANDETKDEFDRLLCCFRYHQSFLGAQIRASEEAHGKRVVKESTVRWLSTVPPMGLIKKLGEHVQRIVSPLNLTRPELTACLEAITRTTAIPPEIPPEGREAYFKKVVNDYHKDRIAGFFARLGTNPVSLDTTFIRSLPASPCDKATGELVSMAQRREWQAAVCHQVFAARSELSSCLRSLGGIPKRLLTKQDIPAESCALGI